MIAVGSGAKDQAVAWDGAFTAKQTPSSPPRAPDAYQACAGTRWLASPSAGWLGANPSQGIWVWLQPQPWPTLLKPGACS